MPVLNGKHVVVVGGSSGIGLAVASLAQTEGAELTLVSRTEEKLRAAAASLGGKPSIIAVDASDPQALGEAFSGIRSVDHLVCTSGGSFPSEFFSENGYATLRETQDAKLGTQANSVQAMLPHLAEHASIVFTSGASGRLISAKSSALATTNIAIEALAKTLALELQPIRVNVVAPGIVDTSAYDEMDDGDRKAMFDKMAKMLPVGRVGAPEDLARAYVACLTNPYMTGSVVDVDGGAAIA